MKVGLQPSFDRFCFGRAQVYDFTREVSAQAVLHRNDLAVEEAESAERPPRLVADIPIEGCPISSWVWLIVLDIAAEVAFPPPSFVVVVLAGTLGVIDMSCVRLGDAEGLARDPLRQRFGLIVFVTPLPVLASGGHGAR
ncbi:MAG: hypothetical protein A2790_13480 [Phenylobacterium sp. RIFCSPHIGHO2_01_FULL_69_31]|nr:MAG: hypothetical protein A2790_13480 [Phenylobacterium sp. RIFCSPHIGHO2_01_FULL_69_31]